MAELVANQGKMSEMQSHIISGLANLIESRDTDTGEHVTRTSIYASVPVFKYLDFLRRIFFEPARRLNEAMP